ncbi:MAG: alcohol dehydrogenase catalytic domain-containing protein [Lachnospiraceae bacterium]
MKALVYQAPGKIKLSNVPLPELKSGFARIKVKYCGICGGDMGIYAGTHPRAKSQLIPGHEFVGVVEEIKDSKKGFSKGDRIVPFPLISCGDCISCRTGKPYICQTLRLIGIDLNGGMAEYAIVSEEQLVRLNEELPDQIAALIEPFAVAVRAVHQSKFAFLDKALIMGAGPIGILTALTLRHNGALKIIISDIDDTRIRFCRDMGFTCVNSNKINLQEYITKETSGDGMDFVFECSGTETATFEATKLARMQGTICMVGIHKEPHVSNLPELSFKEQTIIATRDYSRQEFERAAEYAIEMKDELEQLISQIVPLNQAESVFEMIKDIDIETVKVLINCT